MNLSFQRVPLKLANRWTIARTAGTDVNEVIVVELKSADGLVGRGESSPTARYQETPGSVENFLRRVDPSALNFADLEGSMRHINGLSPGDFSAKCALNIALVDGAAKRAELPVYDYLNLGFTEGRHVTSFTIGIDAPEVIREKTLAAAAYPVLKVKVGVPHDQESFDAMREVAPDKWVRVDANEGWKTKEEALDRIEWLAGDGHVQFVEQPLPANAPVKDWAWLKQRSPLPIFGDESYHSAADVSKAAECFHGVNVKLVKTGGISAGYEALQAARKAGLKTMVGCMIETSILITAAAHLAELCDYLDIDGNLLITNDPFEGVTADRARLSFASTAEKTGLRVRKRR